MTRRTRIAPTPSGFLHAGNAYAFLRTAQFARSEGVRILLRIDDIDQHPVRLEFLEDIFDTLRWLNISWDDGPQHIDAFLASWSQHTRRAHYERVLHTLRDNGHVFACSCTRSDIQRISPTMAYPGTCRDKGLPLDAEGVSWRLTSGTEDMPWFVVRQKNRVPAYMIASVVDDVLFEVTDIVRGADLEPVTRAQLHLAGLVPELAPFLRASFQHHELILGPDGRKLSKSQGDMELRRIRGTGDRGLGR
jgi:glutamyl-tRNA synthetase